MFSNRSLRNIAFPVAAVVGMHVVAPSLFAGYVEKCGNDPDQCRLGDAPPSLTFSLGSTSSSMTHVTMMDTTIDAEYSVDVIATPTYVTLPSTCAIGDR